MNAQIPQNCDINPGEKTSNMIDESNQGNYEKRSSNKVRRAFSMPRNPFRWSRKFITNKSDCSSSVLTERIREGQQSSMTCSSSTNFSKSLESDDKDQGQHNENNFQSPKIFRRSSFRRLLSRIAQHVTSVSIGINKTSVTANVPDRVPPIGGYQWPPDQTPGVTGLKNHGNTCFMNAVLQCLSHTDILAEYFVLDQYKADLKRRNKLNSKKFGTKGELTEQLANVLKALWTCKNENDHSTSFKAVVDRYGSQFRSSTQHDAQEFLFWLLDKVHEDLNMATKKRYKTVKNNYGRPDEVIAAETLANHIRCNNSFVQAVFQAQFRSSLTCPRCKKQSNTFDPFHCISVQLPQLAQQIIFVTVLYVTQHPRQVKLGLTVPPGSSILALRKQLHADTGIAINRMVLADVNEQGFSRVFYDSQSISTLDGLETIYCIEVPDTKKENTSDLILLIANVRKSDNDSTCRFGPPISVQVNRDCSYVELQKKLLKEMSSTLKPEVFAYNTPLTEMFQIRLQDPSADPDTYLEEVEHPLFMEIIDMALSVLSSDAGPTHIKLLLEWSQPELYFADLSDPIVEHESVALLKGSKSEQTVLTLEQCLEHYTRAETLSAEDAWRCPSCQQYLPVVKTLGLWSLPDILVIHFKRFRQQHDKGADAAKLTTMVKFPLNSFDMSPHLARGSSFNDSINEDNSRNSNSPWKKARDHRHKDRYLKENRYDLYAVCYHQGETLETGHYTAACKNPYDHQWYKFDDQRVSHVPVDQIQEEIVNNEAYILFYQRRKIDNSECSGTSSSSGDHWVSRIAAPLVPQSSCNLVTVEAGSSHNSEIAERMSQEGEIKAVAIENDGECKLDSSITLKSAIVMEKTDESELVDIESLEFMDEGNVLVEDGVKEDKEFVLQDPKVAINGNVVIKVSNKEISEESPQKEALVLQKSDQITLPSAGVGGLNVLAESSKIKAASLQLSNGVISHPLAKSSSYKMKNCDSLTLRRNTSSSCSKDTLIFIDQPTHSLIDNEETFLDSRSLWISPVAPHKLITVSPKN